MGGQTDRRRDRQTDGRTDGQAGGWADGRTDGRMGRQTDGRADVGVSPVSLDDVFYIDFAWIYMEVYGFMLIHMRFNVFVCVFDMLKSSV